MSQREFLYGSVSGDRVYDPLSFPRLWRQLTGGGVVSGYGASLAVIENSPPAMNVKVGLGVAFVLGHYFEVYGTAEVVTIGAANATLGRIDRIVVRRDLAARTTALAVKAGTAAASPAAPALTQVETGVYEVSLAQILVPAASSSVVAARITDERTFATSNLGTLLDTSVGHRHDGTAGGRKVVYTDLTSIPSSFTPAAHSQDHGSTLTGLTDDDHPQYQLESEKGIQNGYPGLDNDTNARIATARLATGTADSTKYLRGDRTWAAANNITHDHSASQGGLIPWASITGAPSSVTPATHAGSHGSGGGDAVTIPYGSVSGKPSVFAPTDHTHAAAGSGGTIPWSSITGEPSTYAPSAHVSSHKTGGSDSMKASDVLGFDRYATVGTVGSRIFVGTTTPSSPAPAEGDIWIKA